LNYVPFSRLRIVGGVLEVTNGNPEFLASTRLTTRALTQLVTL